MVIGLYDIFNERWGSQTVWLYSDPHFGENELESGLINKPTDEEQVARINAKVGRSDTLILLGDIGDPKWLKKLRGYKVLITGNHDMGVSNYKRDVRSWIYDKLTTSKEEVYERLVKEYPDDRIIRYDIDHTAWEFVVDNRLCDEVYTGPLIIGPKLILSHEPISAQGMYNIHGHVHQITPQTDHNMNVCSMNINYTPVNLNQLIKRGLTSKVESLHRQTIDRATERSTRK